MKVEVTKAIPEQKHRAVITRVLSRTTPQGYEYTDVYFQLENYPEIKFGAPSKMTVDQSGRPTSKLAKLVSKFTDVKNLAGEVDLESILVGKQCELLTMNEVRDTGTFAEIVDNSIRAV